MKKLLLLVFYFTPLLWRGSRGEVLAQNQHNIDSLLTILSTTKEDTSKVNTLLDISHEKTNVGDYTEARKYVDVALTLAVKIGFKRGIADSYYHFGVVYSFLSDYPKALEYFQKALTIDELLANKKGIAKDFRGIGYVYSYLSDYQKALEYDKKALTIYEQLNNKEGIAQTLNGVGWDYNDLSDYPNALVYYQKALTLNEESGSKEGIAYNLGNIGNIYSILSYYTKALEYDKKALKIDEETGDKYGIAYKYNNIGEVYQKQGKLNEALNYETKGLSIALEIGAKDRIKDAYKELAIIDSAMSNLGGAYENYKLYMQVNDSMFNIEKDKKLTTLAMNYEFAKVQDSTKAEQEKKDIIAVSKLKRQKIFGMVWGLGFVIMLFMVIFYSRLLKRISKEKKRSEELLLNILPSEVAEELKTKGSAEAKQFDDVTVMFTDFKGFTQISEKLSAKELVAEIDHCFKAFDNIIHKHNIEKIKTIGDSYMCAGGLPVPNKTNAPDVVKAAIEIRDFMSSHNKEKLSKGETSFEIRIGINTGPVVAGIVGVKKFAYDIWGDTVNLASRMESSGKEGEVNISGSTYELVKDKFTCIHRGKIQTKNKGEVDMYFVS